MARGSKVRFEISDLKGVNSPSDEDIKHILRAADEIISLAGRNMLAKILKGSKDKKLLEKELDKCPSYGYYKKLSIEEITKIVDWMIINNYLCIEYFGRLPMIIFSERGWEMYKPIYAEEIYNKILYVNEASTTNLIEQLKQTNRQVVVIILSRMAESKNIGFIRFLSEWEKSEVKKVRVLINKTIEQIKSV